MTPLFPAALFPPAIAAQLLILSKIIETTCMRCPNVWSSVIVDIYDNIHNSYLKMP